MIGPEVSDAAKTARPTRVIYQGGGHGRRQHGRYQAHQKGRTWRPSRRRLKVAYADFVTAMMAFFLLMWLINTTTPEQKRGIADYSRPNPSPRRSPDRAACWAAR
jgi:flagellar motor protein MotB